MSSSALVGSSAQSGWETSKIMYLTTATSFSRGDRIGLIVFASVLVPTVAVCAFLIIRHHRRALLRQEQQKQESHIEEMRTDGARDDMALRSLSTFTNSQPRGLLPPGLPVPPPAYTSRVPKRSAAELSARRQLAIMAIAI